MRSVVLTRLSGVFASLLAGAGPVTAAARARGANMALKQHFPDSEPKRLTDAIKDPYFGIATKGRRHARHNFALQQEAFAQTAVGKRVASGRPNGNSKDACLIARRRREASRRTVAA